MEVYVVIGRWNSLLKEHGFFKTYEEAEARAEQVRAEIAEGGQVVVFKGRVR